MICNAIGVKRARSDEARIERFSHQMGIVHTVSVDYKVIVLSVIQHALQDGGFMSLLHHPAVPSGLALPSTTIMLNRGKEGNPLGRVSMQVYWMLTGTHRTRHCHRLCVRYNGRTEDRHLVNGVQ